MVGVAKTTTKSPEAARADLQGCANKPGCESAVSLSAALRCYQLLRGAGSAGLEAVSKLRREPMAPSLGRGRNSAVPLPTLSLPVAGHCGGFLAGDRVCAQSLGSPSLQQRPGGCPRGRALPRRRARLPAAPGCPASA